MRLLLVSMALFALVSGCMVGPDYERPEVPLVDDWHTDLDYKTNKTASLRENAWSEIFNDEQLRIAINEALENNKDLLLAVERITQARAAARVARSDLFPSVDLELHGEREDESGLSNTDPEIADEFSFGAPVSWEIDIWGRVRRGNNAAVAEYLAAGYGAQAIRLSLIADVARAYFELQGVVSRLDVNEQTLAAREAALEIAVKRHKGGLTSKLEVIQSEVEVANTRSSIPRIEQRKLVVENQLSFLMGKPPSHLEATSMLEDAFIPESVTAGLSVDLLEQRPDIMRAEQELVAASERIGVAKARLLPNVALTGFLGYETEEFSDLLDSDGEVWLLELDLVMPLFNAGARQAELSAAESRFNQARINYEKTVLISLHEVSDGLNLFYKTSETLTALLELEASTREYLRLAEKRYRNGVLAYIDVLDARRQLFDAQIAVSNARQNQLFALVDLYRALGGGWDPEDVR